MVSLHFQAFSGYGICFHRTNKNTNQHWRWTHVTYPIRSEKITKCNPGKLVAHLQKFDHQKFSKASHKIKRKMLHEVFGPHKCFQGLEQKKFRMLQNLIRSRKIMELLHGIIGKIISQFSR